MGNNQKTTTKSSKSFKIFLFFIGVAILIFLFAKVNFNNSHYDFPQPAKEYYTNGDVLTKEDIKRTTKNDEFLSYYFKKLPPKSYKFKFEIDRNEGTNKEIVLKWSLINIKTKEEKSNYKKSKDEIEQFSSCLESQVNSISISNEAFENRNTRIFLPIEILKSAEYKLDKNKLDSCVLSVYNLLLENTLKNGLTEEEKKNFSTWEKK